MEEYERVQRSVAEMLMSAFNVGDRVSTWHRRDLVGLIVGVGPAYGLFIVKWDDEDFNRVICVENLCPGG